MASLDKEGLYYVKEDPQLGKIRGLAPWAVENGIHLIRMEQDAAEGIMMIRKSNQQQYGTVHGGVLVAFADTIAGHSLAPHGRMCVTQGSTVNFLRGGGLPLLPGHPPAGGQPDLRGFCGAAQ